MRQVNAKGVGDGLGERLKTFSNPGAIRNLTNDKNPNSTI